MLAFSFAGNVSGNVGWRGRGRGKGKGEREGRERKRESRRRKRKREKRETALPQEGQRQRSLFVEKQRVDITLFTYNTTVQLSEYLRIRKSSVSNEKLIIEELGKSRSEQKKNIHLHASRKMPFSTRMLLQII